LKGNIAHKPLTSFLPNPRGFVMPNYLEIGRGLVQDSAGAANLAHEAVDMAYGARTGVSVGERSVAGARTDIQTQLAGFLHTVGIETPNPSQLNLLGKVGITGSFTLQGRPDLKFDTVKFTTEHQQLSTELFSSIVKDRIQHNPVMAWTEGPLTEKGLPNLSDSQVGVASRAVPADEVHQMGQGSFKSLARIGDVEAQSLHFNTVGESWVISSRAQGGGLDSGFWQAGLSGDKTSVYLSTTRELPTLGASVKLTFAPRQLQQLTNGASFEDVALSQMGSTKA
jgi:hypothetical protein